MWRVRLPLELSEVFYPRSLVWLPLRVGTLLHVVHRRLLSAHSTCQVLAEDASCHVYAPIVPQPPTLELSLGKGTRDGTCRDSAVM